MPRKIDEYRLESGYYLYILLCADNTYYIGSTNNIHKRFLDHSRGKGAKYTAAKKVLDIEALWKLESKSIALSVEQIIKQATRLEKILFVKDTFALKRFYKKRKGIDIKIRRQPKPKIAMIDISVEPNV